MTKTSRARYTPEFNQEAVRLVDNGQNIAAVARAQGAVDQMLFDSLKIERSHRQRFVTRRQAKDETIAWLLWYNKARLHSTLAYVSPMQFEREWLARQVNAWARIWDTQSRGRVSAPHTNRTTNA